MKKSIILAVLLIAGCQTLPEAYRGHAAPSTPVGSGQVIYGILNFAVVDATSGIYRGGQPTAEGWTYLASIGVTNSVKLDLESEGTDFLEIITKIPAGVTSDFGAPWVMMPNVHYFPINFWQQLLFEPDTKAVWGAVTAIGPKTYVHCLHGQDRTGLIVACYRLKNGWSKEQAEKEMLAHGFHKELLGLWNWWEDKAVETNPYKP